MDINVIDLFAGPGGLGEGFFSFKNSKNKYPFQGICSVEMDKHAYSTLTLRAFYRQLKKKNITPSNEYFDYIAGKSTFPYNEETKKYWNKASKETLNLELGLDEATDLEFFKKLKNKHKKRLESKPTVLIGGPPCQAYSLVGRARNKGKKDYLPESDHRHFLYKEYLKIMQIFSPDIFIMENVKGMLSSKINGGAVFSKIIDDLQNCGEGYSLYSLNTGEKFNKEKTNPRDFILKSENYGIPQCRHRVIILGIKHGKNTLPHNVTPLIKQAQVTVELALKGLPDVRSIFSNRSKFYKDNTYKNWKEYIVKGISDLIVKEVNLDKKLIEALKLEVIKLKKSNELFNKVEAYYPQKKKVDKFIEFVCDSEGEKIQCHQPRPHMDTDLLRYFFCAVFSKSMGRNARADDFPEYLSPNHKNWKSGKFVDRFKVQDYGKPSSTITSHISKDGHYFIHPDPSQCRSLTIKEAARLQSFPDSYVFMGQRTNQFHQVGNAVPPLLARQIAKIVYELT